MTIPRNPSNMLESLISYSHDVARHVWYYLQVHDLFRVSGVNRAIRLLLSAEASLVRVRGFVVAHVSMNPNYTTRFDKTTLAIIESGAIEELGIVFNACFFRRVNRGYYQSRAVDNVNLEIAAIHCWYAEGFAQSWFLDRIKHAVTLV